ATAQIATLSVVVALAKVLSRCLASPHEAAGNNSRLRPIDRRWQLRLKSLMPSKFSIRNESGMICWARSKLMRMVDEVEALMLSWFSVPGHALPCPRQVGDRCAPPARMLRRGGISDPAQTSN